MMLVINTAFKQANLAVLRDDGKSFLKDVDACSKHSEHVLKAIDDLLAQADLKIQEIDTVAVVIGPGSFTGLRIGTAIAKALGCANEKMKFLKLSSLSLMAYIYAKQSKGKFMCALNALSGKVFVCTYDQKGINLSEESMIDWAAFEKQTLPKVVLDGDLDGENLQKITISCQELLKFAALKLAKGEFVGREDMVPKYIRLSQAEGELQKKSKKDV